MIIWLLTKNSVILLEEESEYGCRYVQSRRENNANIADSHLVGVCMVDDVDEKSGKVTQEGVVCFWQSVNKTIQGTDLFVDIMQFGYCQELEMKLPSQDRGRQFPKIKLQERSNRMDIVVLAIRDQIYIAFIVESFPKLLDDNVGAAQPENTFFSSCVLGVQILNASIYHSWQFNVDINRMIEPHCLSQWSSESWSNRSMLVESHLG